MSENELKAMSGVDGLTDQAELAKAAMQAPLLTVRLKAIQGLTDQSALLDVLNRYGDSKMWQEAAPRITDQSVLADIAKERDYFQLGRKIGAVKGLSDPKLLLDCAKNAFLAEVQAAAVEKITDQVDLAEIAQADVPWHTAVDAIGKITDPELLADCARSAVRDDIRQAAVSCINSQDVLSSLVEQEQSPEVRAAILERLDDDHRLGLCGHQGVPHLWAGALVCRCCGAVRPPSQVIHNPSEYLFAGFESFAATLTEDGCVNCFLAEHLNDKEHQAQVAAIDRWRDIDRLIYEDGVLFGIRRDGKLFSQPFGWSYNVRVPDSWKDIVDVSNRDYVVGLRTDGTAQGWGPELEFPVYKWHDLAQVVAGSTMTSQNVCAFGLRYDGTVVAGGKNLPQAMREIVSAWSNIVYIKGFRHGVAAIQDGGKVIGARYWDTGFGRNSFRHAAGFTLPWEDVCQLASNSDVLYGLTTDGHVLACDVDVRVENSSYGEFVFEKDGAEVHTNIYGPGFVAVHDGIALTADGQVIKLSGEALPCPKVRLMG